MRIALLAGASPKSCGVCPSVRLGKGSWVISFDGVVDTKLLITGDLETNPIEHGHTLELSATRTVILAFAERGTESFITVTAESK